jgi:hypothetical protein
VLLQKAGLRPTGTFAGAKTVRSIHRYMVERIRCIQAGLSGYGEEEGSRKRIKKQRPVFLYVPYSSRILSRPSPQNNVL